MQLNAWKQFQTSSAYKPSRVPMRGKYMLLNGRLLIEYWLLVVLTGKWSFGTLLKVT